MSKLTKFVNHPKWFFQDALKKRRKFLEQEIKKANNLLNLIGIHEKFDINVLENQILDLALQAYQKGKISEKVMVMSNIRSQIQIQKHLSELTEQLQKISKAMGHNMPHVVFKTTFEMSINPPQQDIRYVGSADSIVTKINNNSENLEVVSNQCGAEGNHSDYENHISDTLSPRAQNLYLKLLNARSHAVRGI